MTNSAQKLLVKVFQQLPTQRSIMLTIQLGLVLVFCTVLISAKVIVRFRVLLPIYKISPHSGERVQDRIYRILAGI